LGDNPYEDPLATIGGADAQVPDGVRWSFANRDSLSCMILSASVVEVLSWVVGGAPADYSVDNHSRRLMESAP